MNTSRRGVELIASFEGFVGHAYKPVPWEKHFTLGFGHYGPDVRAGQTITRPEALALLARDLPRYEQPVNALGVRFTQGQFDALVSLAYNCGPGAVQGSIARLARAGDMAGIPAVMRLYVRAGGHILPGLVRRRQAEVALFRSNTPAAVKAPLEHLRPDERGWAREYDRLKARNQNLARRRVLRAQMRRRRKDIWRAAKRSGWHKLHRVERYHSLLARTT